MDSLTAHDIKMDSVGTNLSHKIPQRLQGCSMCSLYIEHIPTAFVMSYGSGSPIVGVMTEYGDVLPGLGNEAVPEKTPCQNGNASGHACGLNISTSISYKITPCHRQRDEDEWEAKYNQLKTICDETGDVKVKSENGALYCWLTRQKRFMRSTRVSPDHQERPMKLGVGPSMRDTKKKKVESKNYDELWISQLMKLKEYKAKEGNCCVPKHWKENPTLGRWVYQQVKCSKSCLDPGRFEKLKQLDFEWSTQTA